MNSQILTLDRDDAEPMCDSQEQSMAVAFIDTSSRWMPENCFIVPMKILDPPEPINQQAK